MKSSSTVFLLVFPLLAFSQFSTGSISSPPGLFEWAAGKLPILEYDVRSGMPRGLSDTPRLRVYADGTYVVSYPKISKFAGAYYGQLTPTDLSMWLHRVVAAGMVRNKVAELKASRYSQKKHAHLLYDISDETVTTIRIRLRNKAPLRPSGAAGTITNKQFIWSNLRDDARHFPELPELATMQGLADQLEALCEVRHLEKVAEHE